MATAVPWTVTTTKRKSNRNTPDPRKRRQPSLPGEDQADSRSRRQKQQTLTQIHWTPSRPVSFDERELEPLQVKTEAGSRSRRRVPGLKKRDSTLTQMDFLLDRPSFETNEQDLMPLLVTQVESGNVPQLDGTYDSPRKPRPSKTPEAGSRAGSHRKRKNVSLPVDESQEDVPATKRRKAKSQADEASESHRRRSGRKANKVPSDSAESFAIFHEALADTTSKVKRPVLEIEDSTGFDEDEEIVVYAEQNRSSEAIAHTESEIQVLDASMGVGAEILPTSPNEKQAPKTPQKRRQYIPSSQSPESLPPSTRKEDTTRRDTHRASPSRNPLAELSTNTPSRRPVVDIDEFRLTSKKKICTLKLPRIPLGSMKKCVKDSQADIWTVQPTSSPKRNSDDRKRIEDVLLNAASQGEQPEIPSTSQIQNAAVVTSSPPLPTETETQESLISLAGIFGSKGKGKNTSNKSEPRQVSSDPDVNVRDFVTHPQQTPRKQTQYVGFLQTQPEQADEAGEFGSPLANDTQFAAHLACIPTSPLGTSDPLEHLNPHDTIRIPSSSPVEDTTYSSPLPPPKLVDRVEYQNSTTTIPTKDLSSPVLPPMPPPIHRPIAPASLPNPSQVSTQEPSQLLPQLSSGPQRSPVRTQRITIKDSSSMHERLSQLPEYNEDELQLQRELESTQYPVLEDEEEDDVDDDLDPKTPRKTVRFQQPVQGSEISNEQVRVEHQPSSSPAEEPDPLPAANFTQNGHVTAARIEDMRKRGLIPPGYNPPAYKVPSPRELLPAWMFEDDDDDEEE
jgi:hypothetical protein